MVDLGIKEALQYQKDIKSGKIKVDPKPGKNYLDQFIKKRIITPAAGAVDFLTLGATDLDKKGDSGLQTDIKGVLQTTKEKLFNETGKVEKPELGESYSRKQFLDDFRNMQVTDSLLRRGELAAERRESINFMRSMYPLLEQAGRNQLERAIEGDQRSPTKISQQILRAKQGEAALMNAIANQTTSAAQVGNIGTSRRYGRG